jgi:hypothetical protein
VLNVLHLTGETTPQFEVAETQMLPKVNPAPTFTEIEGVPCPETIVTLAGTVHAYDAAPVTAGIENTCPV